MFIVADLVSLKERICSQRERILSFKSSSLSYGNSLLPHEVSSLECYFFITHVRILCNGSYIRQSSVINSKIAGANMLDLAQKYLKIAFHNENRGQTVFIFFIWGGNIPS